MKIEKYVLIKIFIVEYNQVNESKVQTELGDIFSKNQTKDTK